MIDLMVKRKMLTVLEHADEGDDDQEVDVLHHDALHDHCASRWMVERDKRVRASLSPSRSVSSLPET